jgi:hypothetical protein
MKNTKRKVIIASFLATLMLMVPFSSIVAEVKEAEKLGSGQIKMSAGGNLEVVLMNQQPGFIKMLYTLGEQELLSIIIDILGILDNNYGLDKIESGVVTVKEYKLNQIVNSAVQNSYKSSPEEMEPLGVEDAGFESIDDVLSEKEIATILNGEGVNVVNGELEINGEYQPLPTGGPVLRIIKFILGLIKDGMWSLLRSIDKNQPPRLGWINGVANYTVTEYKLRQQLKEDLWPNVTWIEVIDETLAFLVENGIVDEATWGDFNVHDFLFGDQFKNWMLNKAQNFRFKIQGLGIRQQFYEQYILPKLVNHIQSGNVSQAMYNKLNQKVYWGKGLLSRFGEDFGSFLKALGGDRGKERRRGTLKNMTRVIGTLCRVGISGLAYLVYMNESDIEEYLNTVGLSLENYLDNWNDTFNWIATDPWVQSITINGNVTGVDESLLAGIKVWCQDAEENYVTTDGYGNFSGLIYDTTLGDRMPFGLHDCVTTAEYINGNGEKVSVTVGNSGNALNDLLLIGAFSGGILNLTIDFQSGGNNVKVQSQGTQVTQQQTTTYKK